MAKAYLIQRKEDGKYYRNTDFHGYINAKYSKGGTEENLWTSKKSECKPFKSISGAKASRGWKAYKRVRSNMACPLCERGEAHSEQYYAHWTRVKMTEEELPYRVIEVKVTIR